VDIRGKVAVVTGGASGLGEATVRLFRERGAKVAILDRDEARATTLVEELGPEAACFPVDVGDECSTARAVDQVVERFGAIHVCNNFAGIATAHRTVSKDGPHPFDLYTRTLGVNLVGTFNVCRLVAAVMQRNASSDHGRGVITNTASVAAYEGQVGQVAYAASKGGVVSMTLPMARDLAPLGIRVNTIVPGLIHTPLCDGMSRELYESLTSNIVWPRRMGRPEEIAHLALTIVENDYLNGECIRLDGALRLPPLT
jgi:3-hydroxyacyl-CoA dehydrogenase/3-hydroxy-2-methylbutyryl-CoA dehydrogenase